MNANILFTDALKGTLNAGSMILNDYVLTVEETETGSKLVIRRGSEVQELPIQGGAPGEPGPQGVGIESIAPVVESSEPGFQNVHEITLTDGRKYTFSVFNGTAGKNGNPGAPGVSPTISVRETDTAIILIITDANGAQTVTIPKVPAGGGGVAVETDPTVPEWAKQPEKPEYTAEEVGAASAESVAQLKEEVENINALPEGAAANNQLVTDAEGNAIWVPRLCYKEDTSMSFFHETIRFDGNEAIAPANFVLVPGKHYRVLFDSTPYDCVAADYPDADLVAIGNMSLIGMVGGNDEPFMIVDTYDSESEPPVIFVQAGDADHTMLVAPLEDIYHQLDEGYLPDTIARTADVEAKLAEINELPEGAAANQVLATDGSGNVVWEDKPFGEEISREKIEKIYGQIVMPSKGEKIIVVHKNKEYELTVKQADGTYYSMTFIDAVYKPLYAGNTEFASDIFSEVVSGNPITENPSDDVPFFVANWVDNQGMDNLIMCDDDGLRYDFESYKLVSIIKPLDSKFLPSTVPVIQSATVGQTSVVKSVDGGGKPTAWEVRELPVVPSNVSAFENDAGYLTEHQDLSAYAKKSDIPDTSAFITRAVNDLENYYRKGELYTQQQIDQMISTIPKFTISVVSELPEYGFEATIYLLRDGSDENLYTEYIYVSGAWEILGTQKVDLTGYATQAWTLEQLAGYQPKGDYALKSELPSMPTKLSELSQDSTHRLTTDAEKAAWNAKSEFSGNYADLEGKPNIPTVPTNVSAFTNDAGYLNKVPDEYVTEAELNAKGYLTQHQDISHKLDANKLPEAINAALAQAKASGEFDGEDGYTPVKGVDYWTPADQEEITEEVSKQLTSQIVNVPAYVVEEAESVIDRVIAAQGKRTFTVAITSDMHYGSSDYTDGVLHCCQGLEYIKDRIKLDAVIDLGDRTDEHQMNTDSALTDLEITNKLLDPMRTEPNLRQRGNHDFNTTPNRLYRQISAYSDNVVWGSMPGGYYYRDFADYKLRIISVNTTEVVRDNLSVSDEQYAWFIGALDLSSKEDAIDWGILLISHHPLDWTVTNGEYRFGAIANAYQTGASWTDGTISCDYTNKNAASLIGNIHGHLHNLLTDKLYIGVPGNSGHSDVYRMCIPAARVDYVNHYSSPWQEAEWYNKTQNTAKDTAFCVVCIDLDTRLISAICYGAGYDRTIAYIGSSGGVVAYTNQIPLSTDYDGKIYNEVGYKADTRWSASSKAETTLSGAYLTGYIPVTNGDIVRLRNITMRSTGTTNMEYVAIFGTNKDHWQNIYGTLFSDTTSLSDILFDDDNNVVQFKISGDGIGYVRIGGAYIGADSIVTVNEIIV